MSPPKLLLLKSLQDLIKIQHRSYIFTTYKNKELPQTTKNIGVLYHLQLKFITLIEEEKRKSKRLLIIQVG